MARTSKQDDEFALSDLPPWAQAASVFLVVMLVFWAVAPRWIFYLTVAAMGAVSIALIWHAAKEHGSLWAALKAAASGYREVHESWEADQQAEQEARDRTPPLTSYQKSKLKKAVGLQCEHPQCTISRSLHVHHITPRSQGGGNELGNLIVLCRNHHADADAGSISRATLRELIRGERFRDDGVKDYWAKSAAS